MSDFAAGEFKFNKFNRGRAQWLVLTLGSLSGLLLGKAPLVQSASLLLSVNVQFKRVYILSL